MPKILHLVDSLWILEPTKIYNHWGGFHLSERKGETRARVGEYWELSTMLEGHSTVKDSNGKTVLLGNLLQQENPYLKHYPYVAKYLNAEGPLSIQIHPSKEAIEALQAVSSEFDISLNDNGAKQESFYILEPGGLSPAGGQLVYGILEDKLSVWNNIHQGMSAIEIVNALSESCQQESRLLLAQNHIEGTGWHELSRAGVLAALEFHLQRRLPWNEKLKIFKAMGLIWLIQGLAMNGKQYHALYEGEQAPLLSYFNFVQVERDNWLIVRPGMIHAWQGQGNLLIELSHRSNNTLRIMDYGNELYNSTRRKMHYLEAMFALEEWSVINAKYSTSSIQKITALAKSFQVHDGLNALTQVSGGDPLIFSGRKLRSFVMNPDGGIKIRTFGKNSFEVSLGPCRTVLIKSGTSFEVKCKNVGDRILHFWQR